MCVHFINLKEPRVTRSIQILKALSTYITHFVDEPHNLSALSYTLHILLGYIV